MEDRLFSFDNLNPYRYNTDIERSLKGVQLLNFREFSGWYRVPEPRRLPYRKPVDFERGEAVMEEELKESEEISLTKAIDTLVYEVCKGDIDEEYLKGSFLASYGEHMSKTKVYDLLVAVCPGYEELNDTTKYPISARSRATAKMEKVVGFIIVELGECKSHPDAYAVNLICTAASNGCSVKAAQLLGAYLFCIKQMREVEQLGLLELADGYENIGGFSAYSKMGFDKNISMGSKDCFRDIRNLSMSVDLNKYSEESIIGFASGKRPRRLEDVKDDTGLFALGLPQSENEYQEFLQMDIAIYANLLYKFQVAEQFSDIKAELFDRAGKLLSEDEVEIFLSLDIVERNIPYIIQQIKSKMAELIEVYKNVRKNPLVPRTRGITRHEVSEFKKTRKEPEKRRTRRSGLSDFYGGKKIKTGKRKIKRKSKKGKGKRKSTRRRK